MTQLYFILAWRFLLINIIFSAFEDFNLFLRSVIIVSALLNDHSLGMESAETYYSYLTNKQTFGYLFLLSLHHGIIRRIN